MTTGDRSNMGFSFLRSLFFLLLVLSGPGSGFAQDKTPPCYSEQGRKKTPSAAHPFAGPHAKDFSAVFTEPQHHNASDQPVSQKDQGIGKDRPTGSKPDVKDLAGQVPGLEKGALRTQEYVVKEGDYLVKILREKGLIKDHNLPDLLSLLRKLNTSLQDLDLIQPGEKIVILVKVMPEGRSDEVPLHQLKYDRYRVKRGDYLTRIATRRFNLSKKAFYREYLKLFSACNPSIENPDRLLAGQVINLPHYPPSYVESMAKSPARSDLGGTAQPLALKRPTPIERPERPSSGPKPTPPVSTMVKAVPPPPPPKPTPKLSKSKKAPMLQESKASKRTAQTSVYITDGLGAIIAGMGEEWIDSGEHVIPMKSGGHIRLTADSYPIVRLQKGITVIVDVHSALPSKVVGVLESTWANYRVVRLSPNDDLRSTLDKILKSFNYPKILKKGEPMVLGGEIPVTITGDWIITPPQTDSRKKPGFVAIYLMEHGDQAIPMVIKRYLKLLGVEVIEYPEGACQEKPSAMDVSTSVHMTRDPRELVEAILKVRGVSFTSGVNIPAYATPDKDFMFEVPADFCIEIKEGRSIIDVRGLGPDVLSLLRENHIPVLSLAQEKDPVKIVAATLDFLSVPFDKGPHIFLARKGDASRNVKLTVPGTTFLGPDGGQVLATPVHLSPEIAAFLSQKGYRVLVLPPAGPPRSDRT